MKVESVLEWQVRYLWKDLGEKGIKVLVFDDVVMTLKTLTKNYSIIYSLETAKQRKECKSMQISHNQAEFILNPERGFKLLLVSSSEKISDLLLICLFVFEIYPAGNEDTSPTISGKFGKSTTQKCPKGLDGICSQKGWDLTIDSESLVWIWYY